MGGRYVWLGAAALLAASVAAPASAQRPQGLNPYANMLCRGNLAVLRVWEQARTDMPGYFDYKIQVEGRQTAYTFGMIATGFPATASLPSVTGSVPAFASTTVTFGTGPSVGQPITYGFDDIVPGTPRVTIRACRPTT